MNRAQVREQAVREKRFWLKIANACNNHCVFCLDGDHHPGEDAFIPFDRLREQIRVAAASAPERLILSGGEPTLHPHCVDLIRCAREYGFTHIQIISNGRRFAYAAFAAACVAAGLSEATISIHGHTPELHDRLTGVPGAFLQAQAGIANLLRGGRCIVSIDIVVSRQNYRHVKDVIDRFMGAHVYEYDLLYPVPFGSAHHHWDELRFSYEEAIADLRDAFARSRGPAPVPHIWTNRFPACFLEDFEELVQDPHKLHDEVEGRRHLFDAYARGECVLSCADRCRDCFAAGVCADIRRHVDGARNPASVAHLAASRCDATLCAFLPRCRGLVSARLPLDVGAREALLAGPLPAGLRQLAWVCDNGATADAAWGDRAPVRGEGVEWQMLDEGALQSRLWHLPVAHAVVLSRANRQFACAHWDRLRASSSRIEWVVPTFAALPEAQAEYAGLGAFLARADGLPVRRCAPCLTSSAVPEMAPWFWFDAVHAWPALDLHAIVYQHILNACLVKSARCTRCAAARQCHGMHLNYVRTFGFKALQPLEGAVTWR